MTVMGLGRTGPVFVPRLAVTVNDDRVSIWGERLDVATGASPDRSAPVAEIRFQTH